MQISDAYNASIWDPEASPGSKDHVLRVDLSGESGAIKDALSHTESSDKANTWVKSVSLRVAALLISSTYLEDAWRSASAPNHVITYVWNRSLTFLPWAGAVLVVLLLVATQLSSLVLVTRLSERTAMAHMIVCAALAASVLLQPYLFDAAWNFDLLSLSIAQLGALGFFFSEAYSARHPFAAPQVEQTLSGLSSRSPPTAYFRLFARFALTSDLTITFGKRFVEETASMYSRWMAYDEDLAAHLERVAQVDAMVQQHELHKDLSDPDMLDGNHSEHLHDDLHDVLAEQAPQYLSISDAHTAFAALLMLAGGAMVWLGFRTRHSATLVAIGALIDACYRFPFLGGGVTSELMREWNRFHFFQALTPVGGLAIIAACGPGELSLDARTKKTD
jgi:uncharacterized membrane protein YphA (DoxX/SURF4 family)